MSDYLRVQVQQMLQEAAELNRQAGELTFQASEIMSNRDNFVYTDDVTPRDDEPDAEPPTTRPAVPDDRFDAEASNRTVVVNDGKPISYGMVFPMRGDWLLGNGAHAGTPPVQGMEVLNDQGQKIGEANFDQFKSIKPNNFYSVAMYKYGAATNLWVRYGESGEKFDDPIVTLYDTGVKLAASVEPTTPPVGPGRSNVQGFGMDQMFAHNPEGRPIPIAWINNRNDVGANSPRESFERPDRRFIVPQVSGYVAPGEVINMKGAFTYLGETGHLAFLSPPEYAWVLFSSSGEEQFIRNLTAMNGQWGGAGEPNRGIFRLYGKHIVIANCSLLHNVDGAIGTWHNARNIGAESCTFAHNLLGPGLQGSHEDASKADAGKLMLIGKYARDISVNGNGFWAAPFRAPESGAEFVDVRNNVMCNMDRFIYMTQSYNLYDTAGNASNNAIITTEQNLVRWKEHMVLVGSRNDKFSATVYADGNFIDTGAGLRDLEAHFRTEQNVVRLRDPITISPATGRAVPGIDPIDREQLVRTVLGRCGAHVNNRTDVDQDIVARILAGDMSRYDGVAGLPDKYPVIRKSDGYQRRLYALPGTDRGIPDIPNASSGYFDPTHSVDGVPDWYKKELGFNSFLQELDLTTKFSHNDGATDFEHYCWRMTGVEPMSRAA